MALVFSRTHTLSRSLAAALLLVGLSSISGCGSSTDATVLEAPGSQADPAAEAKKREQAENFDPTKAMQKKR